MKIIIIGLPYFTKKLANSLSDFDIENTYLSLDTNANKVDKIKYVFNLHNADIVYSIGGALCCSKAISLAIFLNKKVLMHWAGTDVLGAINCYNNNLVNKKYIDNVIHFCEVSWIQDELRRLDINADIVQIASFDKKILESNEFTQKFSILSYISKGREDFYGMNKLIQLAEDFPQIEIKIAGISHYKIQLPNNIKLLGWVDDMDKEYKDSVLYLRLPEHDGLSFSVLEALAKGRYVGYSYNFENTFHINNYSKLKEVVIDLCEKFDKGFLKMNYAGIKFVKERYNKNVVLGTLIEKLSGR